MDQAAWAELKNVVFQTGRAMTMTDLDWAAVKFRPMQNNFTW